MVPLEKIQRVFLDMDGTIYRGSRLFPTTLPFLDFLKERKIGYTFLSNNSSYSIPEYVEKLKQMGIHAERSNFYTSTEYTIDHLHQSYPSVHRLHVLAMDSVRRTFQEAGFELDEKNPQAVVIAFDRSLTYEKLCRTAYFLHRGLPGFVTHPDVYCPTDRETWLIDCGAITRALEISTNTRIKTLGKPDPGMLREAAKRYGVDPHQCLMAGDRLATDISLGIHAGAVTCHILSPEADLLPPEGIVPDYQVRDLGELQTIWTNRERQQKNNKEKEL